MRATAIFHPRSAGEVRAIARIAAETGCPIYPIGTVVTQVIAGIEQRILAHGFEPNIGMNPVSPRVLDVYVSLMYDRQVAGEDAKAMRCHDDVMGWLGTEGHLPSRLGFNRWACCLRRAMTAAPFYRG
ncbi:MAG: hypothetical protein ACKVQK_20085 [Burkholderiales bacterium]